MIISKTVEFKISSGEFKDSLDKMMDNKNHVSRINSSDNDYRGIITMNTFEIEENIKPFKEGQIDGMVNGLIESTETGVKIHLTSTGIRTKNVMLLALGMVFIAVGIISFPFVLSFEPLAMIPFGIIAVVLGYYGARNTANAMMISFERNIFYELNKTKV